MQSSIQRLVSQLRAQLRSSEVGHRIAVHEGRELAMSADVPARALRESGASWDWVALGVDTVNFWDTHVGIIPHPSRAEHYTVGLHWTKRNDQIIRPLATAIVGTHDPSFSEPTGEFQLALPSFGAPSALQASQAATAAITLATQFLSTSHPQSTHEQEGQS